MGPSAVTTIETDKAVALSDFQGEKRRKTQRERRGGDRRKTESQLQLVLIISLSLVTW